MFKEKNELEEHLKSGEINYASLSIFINIDNISSIEYLIHQILENENSRKLTPEEWNVAFNVARQLHQEEIEGAFCDGEHQQGFEG